MLWFDHLTKHLLQSLGGLMTPISYFNWKKKSFLVFGVHALGYVCILQYQRLCIASIQFNLLKRYCYKNLILHLTFFTEWYVFKICSAWCSYRPWLLSAVQYLLLMIINRVLLICCLVLVIVWSFWLPA